MKKTLDTLFPSLFRHEGIWSGTYRHLDMEGKTLDCHESQVECIFPISGPIVYLQKNYFNWPNGKTYKNEFGAILKDEKLFWDTDTFVGYGWEGSGNCFLLELNRKDLPGAKFIEIIVLAEDGLSRVRTWHWFENGTCFKRTLCNETKKIM